MNVFSLEWKWNDRTEPTFRSDTNECTLPPIQRTNRIRSTSFQFISGRYNHCRINQRVRSQARRPSRDVLESDESPEVTRLKTSVLTLQMMNEKLKSTTASVDSAKLLFSQRRERLFQLKDQLNREAATDPERFVWNACTEDVIIVNLLISQPIHGRSAATEYMEHFFKGFSRRDLYYSGL